jgi:hypothetical protein
MSMTGPTAVIYFLTACADMATLEKALAQSATDEQYASLHKAYDNLFEWSSMHDVMLREIA